MIKRWIKRMELWMVEHTDPEFLMARKRKRGMKWKKPKVPSKNAH